MMATGHPQRSAHGDMASQIHRSASALISFKTFIVHVALKSSLPHAPSWCWEARGFLRAVVGMSVFEQAGGAFGYYGNAALRGQEDNNPAAVRPSGHGCAAGRGAPGTRHGSSSVYERGCGLQATSPEYPGLKKEKTNS